MRACKDCRYFVRSDAIHDRCAAPQLVELARLVEGEPKPGAAIPAFLARLNQSACGSPGYWFAENPPPPPPTQELPATAS